jgi:hypothetical protein
MKSSFSAGLMKKLVLLIILVLFSTSLSAQYLYLGPNSALFDEALNRYLLTNRSGDDIVKADSAGSQVFIPDGISNIYRVDEPYAFNIPPTVAATYLGGSGEEGFGGIQLTSDSNGNIYAAGFGLSSDFPYITGCYKSTSLGLNDIFVAKFDPDLTTLLAAAHLGGATDEMYPNICMNNLNQVIITGYTFSDNYPVTPGCYDSTSQEGSCDMFVSILDNDLTTLIASTFLGGNGDEGPYNAPGIAISTENDIYVSGVTSSTDFPTTPSANKPYKSGPTDYYITKFSADLSTILASTYLGGSSEEAFVSIGLDNNGSVIIGGSSQSSDYPTTPGVYNRDHSTGYFNNVFTKFDNNLSTMEASTYIGAGSSISMCIDNSGNIYTTGHVNDSNYPTTVSAYDRTYNGYNEGFITKMDNSLENVLASTFLSGNTSGWCLGESLVFDENGNIYLTGYTSNTDFPVTSDGFDQSYGGGINDGYLIQMDDQLTTLKYSSFHGASGEDATNSIVCDNSGNPIIAGMTSSTDLWTSEDAAFPDYNGGARDWFILKTINIGSICGDANSDETINIFDVTFLINYLYLGGPAPEHMQAADPDGSGTINIFDITYLISFLYLGGSEPICH